MKRDLIITLMVSGLNLTKTLRVLVNCPLCGRKFSYSDLPDHLEFDHGVRVILE